ncbi:MAG: hypothetical protein BWZ07_03185 [Alphaproteobacteria bacterium ADurb.BinA280]|nr:MAG: hypothetical protein BWZ07_03185 [Alphaproteobacteria bacterium ADurb.BinA280]
MHDRIVVGLTCKGHLVFGGCQLLAELHHVLVRLQVRIGFGQRKQAAQGLAQRILGTRQLLHCLRIARVGLCRRKPGYRGIARLDYGFQGFAFMLHVALDRFHQIGDQVIATGQLHVDLGERILVTVARRDQTVVDADCVERDDRDDAQQDQKAHGFLCICAQCTV